MNDCIFCKIAQKKLNVNFVAESDNFFAMRDAHPQADGHTLVIPKKHLVTLLDIPDKLGSEMLSLCKKVSGNLLDERKAEGFNLVMNNLDAGGQVVKHAHVHIIPRKEGDSLKGFT